MKQITFSKCKDEPHAPNASRTFLLCMMLLGIISFLPLSAYAQKSAISGVVLEASSNNSLVGVTVVVKGTSTGVLTDLDGKFSISAPTGSTLVISYIGFEKQEIVIQNQSSISILLKEDSHIYSYYPMGSICLSQDSKQGTIYLKY